MHFFFPDQLTAFRDYPSLLTVSYSAFAAGNLLMCPAVILLKTFILAIMLGWIVLAIGSYLSRTLTVYQCVGLALMSSLPLGVLKGSTTFSFVATIGLCAALLPFDVKVLRDGPIPSAAALSRWIILSVALIGFFFFFGQAG